MSAKFNLLFTLSTITSVFMSREASAQVYERYVEYTVDTIYLKPKSNRIGFNIGGQLDANGDGARRHNFGLYAFGRVNVSRFLFSGLVAMPMPGVTYNSPDASSYNIQEATAVFCFGSERKNKTTPTVSTTEIEREGTLFYTGGKCKEIINVITTTTYVGAYGTGYTTRSSSKGKKTGKVYAELSVPKRSKVGLSAGVFNWARPNNISGVVHATGFSFGFVGYTNKKAKYKFNYQVKGNTCTDLGNGQYNVVPNGKVYKTGKKTGKVNQTIDFGLEFLYAPNINFDIPQYRVFTDDTDTLGHLEDIKKKHFGFRFRTEVRRGIFSMRYEVGLRPGVKYKIGGAAGEDNFATRAMSGGYILMGFGIGIGAW